MRPPGKKRAYAQAQADIESVVNSLATANGFALTSRNPNYGKGSSITWSRALSWRSDALRLLFRWYGRTGYRGIYADLSSSIVLPERSFLVDGYPTAWIARKSSDDLRINESDDHAPSRVSDTLRSDIVASMNWLDRTYATPEAALMRLTSQDRNGVGVATPAHNAVVAHLENLRLL